MDSHRIRRTLCITLMLVGALLSLEEVVVAQETRGSIRGTVTDSSGASVPSANVTVTNTETNISTTVKTSDQGSYFVQNLAPAVYTVNVEKPGFETSIRENVEVVVATPTAVDFVIRVSQTTQSVTVKAHPYAITTTSGDRGTIISTKTLQDLPTELSGDDRRIESFVFLTPGVTGNTFSTRINGSPMNSTVELMDGMPFLDGCCSGELEAYEPPYESVGEFKMQNNAYSAEYGGGVGVENFHFKSGTNQFHGDAYDFLRNNALDSRGFFAPSVSINKQNEFGVTAGGPVYIPHVYNGRNKTFWFTSLTWFRFRGAIRTSLISVPTDAMKNGDFSQLKDANGNLIPIFDPATTRPDGHGGLTRDPFPGNIIPPNRISTLSKAFIPLMPTATDQTKTFNNLLGGVPSAPINNHYFLFKIDHTFNAKTSLHSSYYRTYSLNTSPAAFSGPLTYETQTLFTGNFFRLTLDRNLSSNIQNTFGVSWQRPTGCNCRIPAAQSLLDNAIAPSGVQFPGFSIPGEAFLGSGFVPLFSYIPGFAVKDDIGWVHGRHLLKFGTLLRWQDQTVLAQIDYPGIYGFSTATTSLPDSPNFGAWGNGFASYLLGLPTSVQKSYPTGFRNLRTAEKDFYFQDDFQITKRLTMNFGVRYDIPIGVTEKYDRLSTFDPAVPNPGAGNIPGALVFAGHRGGPCISQGGYSTCNSHLAGIDYKEVAPRLSFAYRLGQQTVVRGGWGMTYIPGGSTKIFGPVLNSCCLAGFQSSQNLISLDGGISPVPPLDAFNVTTVGWDQGLPPVPAPEQIPTAVNGSSIDYWSKDSGRQAYMESWSFTVERELPWQTALEITYTGNQGHRLGANMENLNQVNPKWLSLGSELDSDVKCLGDGTCPNASAAGIKIPYTGFTGTIAQALRAFPQYSVINSPTQQTGNSSYNALQMRAQKNFSNNVSFLVAYTWSKTLSNTVQQFATFNGGPINTYDRKAEKAELPDGYPQVLAISGVYDLPFGPNQRYANKGGVVHKALEGWEVGFVGQYQSGAFLPISGGPSLPIFNSGNRPNVVLGQPQLAFKGGRFDPATDVYLNAAAFANPGPFSLGNAPRYLNIRGFGFREEDFSLIKRTYIKESVSLEFKADFFNLFNRTVFGNAINTNWNDVAGFGRVGAQTSIPRQIQLALKLNW